MPSSFICRRHVILAHSAYVHSEQYYCSLASRSYDCKHQNIFAAHVDISAAHVDIVAAHVDISVTHVDISAAMWTF